VFFSRGWLLRADTGLADAARVRYTGARPSLEGDAAGNVCRRLGRVSTVSGYSLALCCRSGDDSAEAVGCGVDRVGEGRVCEGE